MKRPTQNQRILWLVSAATCLHLCAARAAELQASDGAAGDLFGVSVSQSGNMGLVGAFYDSPGSAYIFRNLNTATGTVTQNVKLTSSTVVPDNRFGQATSLSGNMGLVGAYADTVERYQQGSAYIFRSLDTATGTVTQNVKLTASDAAESDAFGQAVDLNESMAVIGAPGNGTRGAAYLFRNLDTATGRVTQNARLIDSIGRESPNFGTAVSLSGTIALVGASGSVIGFNRSQGSAYVFRDLALATGTVMESAELIASDGAAFDSFGSSLSLFASTGLISALSHRIGTNNSQGAVYVFRNLDTATGTVTEHAKLTASDGGAFDYFGFGLSHSGNTALVGAFGADISRGSAYLFRNVDTATGAVTQSVKLTASDSSPNDQFGQSVSLSGDEFLIGAYRGNGGVVDSGKAYSSSVSAVTTLDAGDATRRIDGISFVSTEDWVVGETVDGNHVTLGEGDTANVTGTGRAVHIGRNAGSDVNTLIVEGNLIVNEVYIGSVTGNMDNTLQLDGTATFSAGAFRLANRNLMAIEGDYTDGSTLFGYLGDTELQVWNGSQWDDITPANYDQRIASSFASGYTTLVPVPEPSSLGLISFATVLGRARKRRPASENLLKLPG